MFSLGPQFTENYASNDSLNKLLDQIDTQILSYAYYEYNCIRLGTESQLPPHLYQDLYTYKEILLDYLLGCNCLTGEFLIKIIYKIKKLINNGIRL